LLGEVQAEKSRHAKRRKPAPAPSNKPSNPPSIPPPSTNIPANETDLEALTRQIDSLRAEVHCLSSEKDALERVVETEFRVNLPSSQPRSPTNHERELALLQENERLREALAQAQRLPSSSLSQSLPSPAVHPSSIYPNTDLFRSPLSDPAAIDLSFPPLTPDQSMSATSTSSHTFSAYDNVESELPLDVSEIIPLPQSPLLSPLLSPLSSLSIFGGSQSQSRALSPLQTPLDMSICSNSPDGSVEAHSPTLRAAAQLRQQREADLQAQLAIEQLEVDVREREMLELRAAIATLALGDAGLAEPDPGVQGPGSSSSAV